MADFFGKMSIFGMNMRIIPEQGNTTPDYVVRSMEVFLRDDKSSLRKTLQSSQLLCELSSKNPDTRSKSNSFSGNRVSPAPLPEERTRSKSNSFSGNRVSPAPLLEDRSVYELDRKQNRMMPRMNVEASEDKHYIENTETLPCTPIPDEYGQGAECLQQLTSEDAKHPEKLGCGIHNVVEDNHAYSDEYDTWLEIDHTSEDNYTSHIRMMYKQVLDDLYRRFVPPTDIHEKYLEEIRSPSWETFEKKHKK